MAIRFTDGEIAALVAERKPLPPDYRARLKLSQKRGHEEAQLSLRGAEGSEFLIVARRNSLNPLDFSIILAVGVPGTNAIFRLRRHNGKSHQHSNRIEDNSFYDFHIHLATERYQDLGMDEDAYAEPTTRFADYYSAFDCLATDCGLEGAAAGQRLLFGSALD